MDSNFGTVGIAIGLTITLVAYLTYKYLNTYTFWSSRGINGPIPLPFFGNSLSYILNCVPEMDNANRRKYGKLYGIYDGERPILMVSDPEIVEKIMITEHNSFKYHINQISSDPLMKNAILFVRGEAQKRIRAVFSTGMTQGKLKQYFDIIQFGGILKYLNTNVGKKINVLDMVSIHQLNVILQTFYGLDFDLFNNIEHPVIWNAKNLFVFFNALPAFIGVNIPFLFRFLNDPSSSAHEYIAKLVTFAFEERKKSLSSNSIGNRKKPNDFLQLIMDSNLTELQKLANAISAIGAGFDTVSSTIAHMFYELGLNPHIYDRLQNEIDSLYEGNDKNINFEDLSKLTFMENCFTETLRMHPTDVRMFRESSNEAKIPTTDIIIPANIGVNVPTYVIHFDSEIFCNPEKFDPDRWTEERRTEIKNCSFMSFGAGPRKCPGGQFALMNFKLIFVTILRRYKLELCKESNVKIGPGRMMSEARNIWANFNPKK